MLGRDSVTSTLNSSLQTRGTCYTCLDDFKPFLGHFGSFLDVDLWRSVFWPVGAPRRPKSGGQRRWGAHPGPKKKGPKI